MLNYFFYRDYMYNRRIGHADPLITSAITISALEFVNLFTVFTLADGLRFHLSTSSIFGGVVIVAVVLLYANIRYFKRHKRAICDRYSGETELRNVLGKFFYVGYLLMSIFLLIGVLVVL